MGKREVFINELGISKHITLIRRFNCEECNQLIGRGERYWEINHYGTPSAFDDGHMHVLCTTCAPRIENAEAIFISYYAKFLECDYHRTHIRKIERMANPAVSNLHDSTSVQSDKKCPDCSRPMILKNGTYSCLECDIHIDAECEKFDIFCKDFDVEAFARSGKKSITITLGK